MIDIDIKNIKSGDTEAFRRLFEYFYPKIMALACRFVKESVAKDMVQDVFVAYWEQKENLEIRNIQSYLFKSVQNNCLNYIKHQLVVEEYENRVRIAEARIDFLNQSSDDNSFFDLIAEKDLKDVVEDSILKLPPKCQQAFRLCYFENLTYKEIAQTMQISHRTAEVHIQKAVKFLKQELKTVLILLLIS